MPEKTNASVVADAEDEQGGLKKALMVFAIIEALVLIPIVLYMIFR